MKKGQAEIIGLVVVVLLLVFALIFFIKIRSGNDDNETKLIRANFKVNSALNALMKVSIGNEQMKDLIDECVLGFNACDDDLKNNLTYYFEDPEKGLFKDKKYQFIISRYNDDLISLGDGCKENITASPFVVRNSGKVELKICT
ncbi:hypothetical protein HYT56_02385 [Candidatus Woesearchaeota archaeon]|nr:hypothetical protein [Candidatus Woesearchaeota archaeon]